MTILDDILKVKYEEVKKMKNDQLFVGAGVRRPSLFERLKNAQNLQVIAEMKRASPSKGMIKEGANPVAQAQAYERAGAACISVLTDEQFFKGSMDDLKAVAKAVQTPLLCKDFIVDEKQIDRAKVAGASVVLLIVAALDDETLKRLHVYALSLELEVLVEVHDIEELTRALQINAKLIGVNNRDLKTFKVDLTRTEEIAAKFPFDENRVFISESGIVDSTDAKQVADVGARAILVGETLMRSDSVVNALQALQVQLPERVQ